MIRVLEPDGNRRGDLFTRLVAEMFRGLGYETDSLNLASPGREIDIILTHRTEWRTAIVECKAHKKPVGGDATSKFYGAFEREWQLIQRNSGERQGSSGDRQATAYFVSLSGYTAPAKAQEADSPRMVLMDGDAVLGELEGGSIVVRHEDAIGAASQYLAVTGNTRVDGYELVVHEAGIFWAVYFRTESERSHLGIVGADGYLAPPEIAELIAAAMVKDDQASMSLTLISSPELIRGTARREQVLRSYRSYVAAQFGIITFEGMSADEELAYKRLQLESVMVPLHLVPGSRTSEDHAPHLSASPEERLGLGQVLRQSRRMLIIADPGAGKSTLVKRCAVAYTSEQRRHAIDDGLPDEPLFPIVLRCRDLTADPANSLYALLRTIPDRGGFNEYADDFVKLSVAALQRGDALLLIDGLDEIPEDKRLRLAEHLRNSFTIYPAARIVVTSREAGLRPVAAKLGADCDQYQVDGLSDPDIHALTAAWLRQTGGTGAPDRLAHQVCSLDRIRRLARNPLLLTIILLVYRRVGQIPARRSALYFAAIRALLETWGVEARAALEVEEAIPQLAYVAFSMMAQGVQQISARRLTKLLLEARRQFPAVLGFTKLSVAQFVDRIEDRSSLLMWSGAEFEDGLIQDFYEFKHLTFQEYLAAYAVVEGYVPERNDRRELEVTAELRADNRYFDPRWQEVVPLAAVLAGRRGGDVVKDLISHTKSLSGDGEGQESLPVVLLRRCLSDDVQIVPDLVDEGLEWVIRKTPAALRTGALREIAAGRYRAVLWRVVARLLGDQDVDPYAVSAALDDLASSDERLAIGSEGACGVLRDFVVPQLTSGEGIEQGVAIAAFGQKAKDLAGVTVETGDQPVIGEALDHAASLLSHSSGALAIAACVAIERLAGTASVRALAADRVAGTVLLTWETGRDAALRRAAASTYAALNPKPSPAASSQSFAFHLLLMDPDDATGLARLLEDVRMPSSTVTASFQAAAGGAAGLVSRADDDHGPTVDVYLLMAEEAIVARLPALEGSFVYVGIPDLADGSAYGPFANVRLFRASGPLDFATEIMRDFSALGEGGGADLFDAGEAQRMMALAADFPMNLEDPAAYGYPAPYEQPFDIGEPAVATASAAAAHVTELEVVGIRMGQRSSQVTGLLLDQPDNQFTDTSGEQPLLLLKEKSGDRFVPIWVGASEATAIASAQQRRVPSRPLVHDLMRDILNALKIRLLSVTFAALRDGVVFAELNLAESNTVSSRPSDAAALALWMAAPLYISAEILGEAGMEIPGEPAAAEKASDSATDTPHVISGLSATARRVELEIVGVRVDAPSNQPIVLMKEKFGDRYLPIWIGPVEAMAVAVAEQGIAFARPQTHDLIKDILESANIRLLSAIFVALADGIYYTDLNFSDGSTVSSRPSDAISLVLRTRAQLYATAEIIDEAGVAIPEGETERTQQ